MGEAHCSVVQGSRVKDQGAASVLSSLGAGLSCDMNSAVLGQFYCWEMIYIHLLPPPPGMVGRALSVCLMNRTREWPTPYVTSDLDSFFCCLLSW